MGTGVAPTECRRVPSSPAEKPISTAPVLGLTVRGLVPVFVTEVTGKAIAASDKAVTWPYASAVILTALVVLPFEVFGPPA